MHTVYRCEGICTCIHTLLHQLNWAFEASFWQRTHQTEEHHLRLSWSFGTNLTLYFPSIYCVLEVTNTVKQQQLIHFRKLAKPCVACCLRSSCHGNLCFVYMWDCVLLQNFLLVICLSWIFLLKLWHLPRVCWFCAVVMKLRAERDCEWQIGFLMRREWLDRVWKNMIVNASIVLFELQN